MTNLDTILKSRDITLPTKVHLVKAMVFPVVMYRCESWTIKMAEHWRTDPLIPWCRRLLRVAWTARSNQSILKEISPKYSLEARMLKLKLQCFDHVMWRANLLEKTLILGTIEARRRRGNRVWDKWMTHLWLNGHESEQTSGDSEAWYATVHGFAKSWTWLIELKQKKRKQTLHYNPMFIKCKTGQTEKTRHTWIDRCAAVVVQSLGHVWLFYNSMDCSPPGTSDHGIFQAGIVEWIAISFSRGSSQTRDRTCISCIGRLILYHWATRKAPSCVLKSKEMVTKMSSQLLLVGERDVMDYEYTGFLSIIRARPLAVGKQKWKLLSRLRLFATPWTIYGILQARILEWVAFPFSRGSSQPRNWTGVSSWRPTEL